MFIKKDITTIYKQTILGPIWLILQPVFLMLVYNLIFFKIAKIPTNNIPPQLFYLSGIIFWNFFSESFNQSADTLFQNSQMYGKIYFPRLVTPLAKVVTAFIKLLIQLSLFVIFYLYFIFEGKIELPGVAVILLPALIINIGILGLGAGIIISSITVKYRDLKFVVSFGLQLLMFATPIFYPLSFVPEKYQPYISWNPVAHIIEAVRQIFFGIEGYSYYGLFYSITISIVIFIFGLMLFRNIEKDFIDII